MPRHRRCYFQCFATIGLSVILIAVFSMQVGANLMSASRSIGVVVNQTEAGLSLDSVNEGGPADRGGLRAGDELVAMNQQPIQNLIDYDRVAETLRRDRPATFTIKRNGALLDITVNPGIGVNWLPILMNSFTLLCFVALMWLIHRERDLVARLLYWFGFLVALELALPMTFIGSLLYTKVAYTVYYLISGAQLGVELHLASVIPKRRKFIARWPWIVPLYYVVGLLVSAMLITATFIFYSDLRAQAAQFLLFSYYFELALLPIWATLILGLLIGPALRYPEPTGRQQALLVFLGILPWAIYTYATTFELISIESAGGMLHLSLLIYIVAVFWAILRYQLIDIEMVVRRGLLYTTLTLILVGLSYVMLSLGGAVLTKVTGEKETTIWMVGAVAMILGLFFAPLRGLVQRVIDRRLFPERERLRERLTALASELPALGRLETMGRHLVERMAKIFDSKSATLFIATPHSGAYTPLAWHAAKFSGNMMISAQDPGLNLLATAGHTMKSPAVYKTGLKLKHKLQDIQASLFVPLTNQDKMVGFVVLGEKTTGDRYPAEELDLLNLLAQHVSIVLENVRLFQSATYDSLTGLLRREAIMDLLNDEIGRALRHGRELAVGIADLDHFKPINDRFGHLEGDRLLQRVAREMSVGMRQTDKIGRYGGEEFLMIFPDTDLEGATVVANKIRERMESLEFLTENGISVQARVSIGLTSLEDLMQSGNVQGRDLISAADQALYRAKDAGRNRVEVFSNDHNNIKPMTGSAG